MGGGGVLVATHFTPPGAAPLIRHGYAVPPSPKGEGLRGLCRPIGSS